MKHIGILAHSAEGSALCYLTACHEGILRLGPHMHPDITLDVVAMGESMDAWESDDLQYIRDIFFKTATRLANAGCDFFVCPDNTAHLALEAPGEPFPLPGLYIHRVVAEYAVGKGYSKIGVLGTKWTMDGPLYRDAFADAGLQSMGPEADDRHFVNESIFKELCNGEFREETQNEYLRIIQQFSDQGCDAVVLGCTEIPLLIPNEISPIPTLDSTRLLAIAAVDVALGDRPLPTWCGGKP